MRYIICCTLAFGIWLVDSLIHKCFVVRLEQCEQINTADKEYGKKAQEKPNNVNSKLRSKQQRAEENIASATTSVKFAEQMRGAIVYNYIYIKSVVWRNFSLNILICGYQMQTLSKTNVYVCIENSCVDKKDVRSCCMLAIVVFHGW